MGKGGEAPGGPQIRGVSVRPAEEDEAGYV